MNLIANLVSYGTLIVATATAISTIWYTKYTRDLVRAEFGPKLYINIKQVIAKNWNKNIMSDFYPEGVAIKGKGFTPPTNYKWVMEVVNNGEAPATDVSVDYLITAYVNEIRFESDGIGIEDFTPKVYKMVEKSLLVDYIPPGGKFEATIMYMGTFPLVKCTVKHLRCNEKSFISKITQVANYEHPEFNMLVDSPHLRRLLGLMDYSNDA